MCLLMWHCFILLLSGFSGLSLVLYRELACKSATGVSHPKVVDLGCFSLLVHRRPYNGFGNMALGQNQLAGTFYSSIYAGPEECTEIFRVWVSGSFTNLQPCSQHPDQAVGHFHRPETPANLAPVRASYSDLKQRRFVCLNKPDCNFDNTRGSQINSPVVTKRLATVPVHANNMRLFKSQMRVQPGLIL